MENSNSLRIGTAGWAFPHWNGLVYPKTKPRGFHALSYLSQYVDLLEVDTTFHQTLKPEVATLWTRLVEGNPRFQFNVVLNRRFTHERRVEEAEVQAFARGLAPLAAAKRLGCVVMQFPWSFRFTSENRRHFIRLRRAFHGFPLVAEMRHSSWTMDEALGTFIDFNVGFVNLDQPPHVRATPPSSHLTSAIGYVRLHGRNQAHWMEDFGERAEAERGGDYLYSPAELAEWRGRIERIEKHADRTYVVFTNDTGAHSLVNAFEMREQMGEAGALAPAGLLRRFPMELARCRTSAPVQPELFTHLAA